MKDLLPLLPYVTIGIAVIALLFGRDLIGKFKNRKCHEIDLSCDALTDYLKAIDELYQHAVAHQSGAIAPGKTCQESAREFGAKSKAVGCLRKRLGEFINDANLSEEIEKRHLRWKDSLFTDEGLVTSKKSSKSRTEIDAMQRSYDELVVFVKKALVRCKKGKVSLHKC